MRKIGENRDGNRNCMACMADCRGGVRRILLKMAQNRQLSPCGHGDNVRIRAFDGGYDWEMEKKKKEFKKIIKKRLTNKRWRGIICKLTAREAPVPCKLNNAR